MPRAKPSHPSYLLPVQLNVTVPYSYREHLQKLAQRRHTSLAELVRLALREAYPHSLSFPERAAIEPEPDPTTTPAPKPDDDDRPAWMEAQDDEELGWT